MGKMNKSFFAFSIILILCAFGNAQVATNNKKSVDQFNKVVTITREVFVTFKPVIENYTTQIKTITLKENTLLPEIKIAKETHDSKVIDKLSKKLAAVKKTKADAKKNIHIAL